MYNSVIANRRFREEPPNAMEAIEWLKTHRYIWYQAPMDSGPRRLSLTSKLQLWKRDPKRFAVSVESSGTFADPGLRFRIDNAHLDRLRIPYEQWHHGISATLTHQQYVGSTKRYLVLNQSNGYHLQMSNVKHAIAFARSSAIELSVIAWYRGKRLVRTLVPARAPISGERNF